MGQQARRQFSGEEKARILRQHLLDVKPVSEVGARHGIRPSMFYPRQKASFENSARAFEGGGPVRRTTDAEKRAQDLEPPLQSHEHGHVDFFHVNVGEGFDDLCRVLGDCSRAIVHWEIREAMRESDAERVLQRAREKHPGSRPRVISDNGPQFVAKAFKEYIRLWQASHVLTSPYYPQSNGKLERYHRTLKEQAIRPKTPLSLEDARRVVGGFVEHDNTVRLHSAQGTVTPRDGMEGRHVAIQEARDRKLEQAREARRQKREQQRLAA